MCVCVCVCVCVCDGLVCKKHTLLWKGHTGYVRDTQMLEHPCYSSLGVFSLSLGSGEGDRSSSSSSVASNVICAVCVSREYLTSSLRYFLEGEEGD